MQLTQIKFILKNKAVASFSILSKCIFNCTVDAFQNWRVTFNVYACLFQKGGDIHHVEAPQSPQTTPTQPPFKPNTPVSAPTQPPFKTNAPVSAPSQAPFKPFSPSAAAPAPSFKTVSTSLFFALKDKY